MTASKITNSRSDTLDSLDSFGPLSLIRIIKPIWNSLRNSYKKELKNSDPKKSNSILLVNKGINIIG